MMADQRKKLKDKNMGGSMRLGAYPTVLKKDSLAFDAYKHVRISERHRHRFEVNNEYVEELHRAGLLFSGTSPDGALMEVAELPQNVHPFFMGVQYHPELQARPLRPHPLFTAFLRAALGAQKAEKNKKV